MNARHRSRAWLLGPLAIVVMTSVAAAGAGAADPVAGSQGTNTAIPATDSQLTVNGRGTFSDLAITVNQTQKLNNQAVSITWTGGKPTKAGPGRFGSQYLQIMQCWGETDGSRPDNPGPPPEQCEQGAAAGTYGGLSGTAYPNGFAMSRIISRTDWDNFDRTLGVADPRTTNVWLPFRAVGGTVVGIHTDPTFNPAQGGGNFWLNPYFNIITTNEIAGAVTGPDGKGAELFQVLTGVESSGLGCGQRSEPVAGGDKKIPKCWLVIVPRGTPTDENAGTPFNSTADTFGVFSSPVSPLAWNNRIAIPLGFNPVDSPCVLGADQRRISGGELALAAVASWQPALCTGEALPPFSYAPISDGAARQQLVSGQSGAPGLVVVSRPLNPDSYDPKSPVLYAPVSALGLTIGFNIERNPTPDAPSDAQQLSGVRIAHMNLTPRLVAKLLTQSYAQAVTILQPPDYSWVGANPGHLGLDPDFQQFNPEFAQLQIADGRTFSGLQLPAGNSDAAQQVWEWMLSDPEAAAWLSGTPDEWGMKVNPAYATSASTNSNGIAFGDPVPSSFPKADPYCYQAPSRGPGNSIVPPPLCGTDWMPYKRGFSDAAQVTRSAADPAKVIENLFATSSSDVWKRDVPQYLGRRDMLAMTDTASATQFGLQTASLSRSGDNGPNRSFVAVDSATLAAGLASMAPKSEPTVLEPNPTAVAPGAYPLTAINYAAIQPLSLDTTARSQYAAFVDYAVGPGQVPGLNLGQLPRGYVPLPDTLKAQATAIAERIRTLVAVPDQTTTTTAAPTTSTDAAPTVTTPRPKPSRPSVVAPPPTLAPITTEPVTTVPTVTTTTVDVADQPAPSTPTVLTPIVGLARSRYAVPGLAIVALGSALGALEVTKRPRRRRGRAVDTANESVKTAGD